MAICWKHLKSNSEIIKILDLSQSAGNYQFQGINGILRDYTPQLINYKKDLLPFSLTVATDKRKFNEKLIELFKKEVEADKENINPNFGYYLAGLIEGDGTIIVPKTERSIKGRINYPSIQICFDSRDLPLAIIIQKEQGFGSLNKTKGVNAYRLTINNYEGLIKLAIILNGKLRTVKINEFNLLLSFQNNRFSILHINPQPLDKSSFDQNAWLSGFIDAVGHFYIRLRKNTVTCGFELVQAISDYANRSNKEIKEVLSIFFKRDLREINKEYCNGKNQKSLRLNSLNTNLLLVSYLTKWPLFSSKYLNYQDYNKVLKMIKNCESKHIENIKQIKEISENKNSKRTKFNWDHQQNFYNIYK